MCYFISFLCFDDILIGKVYYEKRAIFSKRKNGNAKQLYNGHGDYIGNSVKRRLLGGTGSRSTDLQRSQSMVQPKELLVLIYDMFPLCVYYKYVMCAKRM